MTMKDNIKMMNPNKQHDDFDAQWQRRQDWEQQADKALPDDKTFMQWAEKAQQVSESSEVNVVPLSPHRNRQWIPYAAAASVVIGVAIIGLSRYGQSDNRLPVAEEVTVESQTIHFMCNNGCSAQDIMSLANKAFK